MKLPQPFLKLPLQFDVQRLAEEVCALPPEAWAQHPNGFPGNSAVRLISVGGLENDDVSGRMEMTDHLRRCAYIQQVLASFGVVWGRSRLMRLAPGASVPEHADTNYHWFTRVRVHIPVLTRPGVLFHCDDQVVHMAAGDAWIFDNWRLHRVDNATSEERIHLVADTSGSAAFWNMVASAKQGRPPRPVAYQPSVVPSLALERFNTFRVMPPAEVELLLGDLGADLALHPDLLGTDTDLLQFQSLLRSFCADWRQLWLLYGDGDEGLAQFRRLTQTFRELTRPYESKLCTRSNKLPAIRVLDARVIGYLVNEEALELAPARSARPVETKAPAVGASPAVNAFGAHVSRQQPRLEQPIFIMAAPRSGSTLLFETLACTPQLWSVGGEAHWLVEGFDHLSPGAPGIDDNRIDATHATPELRTEIERRLVERLLTCEGQPAPTDAAALRLLEKTPKNALRIPFFAELFPDARFVFLWRDPRENLSSIIEAWKSGGWVTYSQMPDWDGPWSLILPPGWRQLRGQSLGEIAAFQWETTNRMALDDLSALSVNRWMAVEYADFLADPEAELQRICDFAGIEFDAALRRRIAVPLPLSRHTHTPPSPQKWHKNAPLIDPVMNNLQDTWARLRALRDSVVFPAVL